MKFQEIADRKKEWIAAGKDPQRVMEETLRDILAYRKLQSERLNGIIQVRLDGCDAEEGSLRMAFPVEEWELNPAGTLHGGIFATAVDIAMGMLAHYYGEGQVCTTVNMNLNYLRPVKKDDVLIVESKLEKLGRTLVSMSVKGYAGSDGRTAVTGIGTYMILDRKLD
ncbi:MAG: PaaI family thioesterase [Lachnospiraceae bacterium]|nr:PaaI family thioesterase [Lachnospiraceae bacterium]